VSLSPKRYFLNAPKEQPGTCFVLNSDYEALMNELLHNAALRAVLREYMLAHPAHWQYSANARDLEDRARALLAEKT
jgi:hypothetical protein